MILFNQSYTIIVEYIRFRYETVIKMTVLIKILIKLMKQDVNLMAIRVQVADCRRIF